MNTLHNTEHYTFLDCSLEYSAFSFNNTTKATIAHPQLPRNLCNCVSSQNKGFERIAKTP